MNVIDEPRDGTDWSDEELEKLGALRKSLNRVFDRVREAGHIPVVDRSYELPTCPTPRAVDPVTLASYLPYSRGPATWRELRQRPGGVCTMQSESREQPTLLIWIPPFPSTRIEVYELLPEPGQADPQPWGTAND